MIPPIGNKLSNYFLMNNDILYLSDFLDDNNNLLSYPDFLEKWGILDSNLKSLEYSNIISAIKQFHRPNKNGRDIAFVDSDVNHDILVIIINFWSFIFWQYPGLTPFPIYLYY